MPWRTINLTASLDELGLLPAILLEDDPASVKEQLDTRYAHGGGARPIEGFRDAKTSGIHVEELGKIVHFRSIVYPGDPVLHPRSFCVFEKSNEYAVFYGSSFVGVFPLDEDPNSDFIVYHVD